MKTRKEPVPDHIVRYLRVLYRLHPTYAARQGPKVLIASHFKWKGPITQEEIDEIVKDVVPR